MAQAEIEIFLELFSHVAASYRMNELFIDLRQGTNVFTKEGKFVEGLTSQALGTFAHEVMHYLHNLSTLSGYKNFLAWQHLLAEFSYCFSSKDFESQGSPENSQPYFRIATFLSYHHGDSTPRWYKPSGSFNLSKANAEPIEIQYLHGVIHITDLQLIYLVDNDGYHEEGAYRLGTHAISEGIAFEVESFFSDTRQNPPPHFPYRVFRDVLDMEASRHDVPLLSRSAGIALGILSLSSPDPSGSLLHFLDYYADRVKLGRTEVEVLKELGDIWIEEYKRIRPLLELDLQSLQQTHLGRGLTEHASKYFSALMTHLLDRRLKDPFFDIRFLDERRAANLFLDFLSREAPCDVLQRFSGDQFELERDALLSFQETHESIRPLKTSDVVRVHQCQMHLVGCHLSPTGFLKSENVPVHKRACPFFTACNLPTRKDNPEICSHEPWKAADIQGTKKCWYGAAVISVLGQSKLTFEEIATS